MGFFDRFKSGETLFYPGCLAKHNLKSVANNYITLLQKLGVNLILLKDEEVCCGYPALSLGYKPEFEDLRLKNMEIFRKHNVKKIITLCPSCYLTFKNYEGMKVEHVTQTLAKYLRALPVKYEKKITYYDPCCLSRKGGVMSEPRAILKALGFEVVELEDCREKTMCCGAGGGMKHNLPSISNKIAKKILSKVKTKTLITSCPLCYAHLKENSSKVEVLELSQVLV